MPTEIIILSLWLWKFLLIQFQIIISVLGNMSGSCFFIRDSDGKDVYGIWNVKDKDVKFIRSDHHNIIRVLAYIKMSLTSVLIMIKSILPLRTFLDRCKRTVVFDCMEQRSDSQVQFLRSSSISWCNSFIRISISSSLLTRRFISCIWWQKSATDSWSKAVSLDVIIGSKGVLASRKKFGVLRVISSFVLKDKRDKMYQLQFPYSYVKLLEHRVTTADFFLDKEI